MMMRPVLDVLLMAHRLVNGYGVDGRDYGRTAS